jgi:tetratricopeptide (TPR) repeat protein
MTAVRFRILVIVVFVAVVFGCSTKKNTVVTRSYHNLTAHYNAYFNGRDHFKVAVKNFEKNYADNFTKLLPVFKYPNKVQASSLMAQMEVAIKKSTKVITRHSITVKPKKKKGRMTKKEKEFYNRSEFNKWIDNSYFLIGKANFYKADYLAAKQSFDYVVSQYPWSELKYEAMLWSAKCLIKLNHYEDAESQLLVIDGERKLPRKLKPLLATTFADLYLQKKDYSRATTYLNKAITLTRKKITRLRYMFILAQVYELTGHNENASNLYAKVAKSNPPYEMQFAALIHRATSFAGRPNEDPNAILKQLRKMLRDDKNIEYQGRIYYAMGSIQLKMGEEEEALKNLKLSTQTSGNDLNQKAQTLLLIATILFDKGEFEASQPYYDSSLMFLDKDYPNYLSIKEKSDNLTDLVTNLNTVHLQDSLQALAAMSEKKRNAAIKKIIAAVKRRKAEQKRAEAEAQQFHAYGTPGGFQARRRQNGPGGIGGAKWYFYNPATIGMGSADFKRKWGTRKLEDNWRRKNKAEVMEIPDDEEANADSTESGGKKLTDEDLEYYLRQIPLTDSAMKVSNANIEKALFNVANLYKERFKDTVKSIHYYEELLKRYPKTKHRLVSYYDLYRFYKTQGNISSSNHYKEKILSEFPNSEYAKIIQDPTYLKHKQQEQETIRTLYVKTYDDFSKQQFDKVFANINRYKALGNSYLDDKFELIKGLTFAKQRQFPKMVKTFKALQKKYPQTAIDTTVSFYLDYFNANDSLIAQAIAADTMNSQTDSNTVTVDTLSNTPTPIVDTIPEEDKLYNDTLPSNTYFYIIVVHNDPEVVNKLKFNIINFNVDHFAMFDFQVKTTLLNINYKLIAVKQFKSRTHARKYYRAVLHYGVFDKIDPSEYKNFFITTKNLETLQQDKRVELYLKFFERHYISNGD